MTRTTHMVVDLTNPDGDEEWLNASDEFLAANPWATRSLFGSVGFSVGAPDGDGYNDEFLSCDVAEMAHLVGKFGNDHEVRLWLEDEGDYLTGHVAIAHIKRLSTIPDEHQVSTFPR